MTGDAPAMELSPLARRVMAILEEVPDPEVPVLSVVELGIVRDVVVDDAGHVTVQVTPTYSGCPAMRAIEDDIVAALRAHGFARVSVQTTYTPAWTTDWMSAEAKAKLKAYGIAPPGRLAGQSLVQLVRSAVTVPCPYCDSRDTERRSEFGSTACKAIHVCRNCRQPFEEFKAI
jgi:ring-1,2-phenylacetyl-CoA epoxidase subunit PaaD